MNRLPMTEGNYPACIEGRKTQTRRVIPGRTFERLARIPGCEYAEPADLKFFWDEFACEKDEKLTPRAQELKRAVLALAPYAPGEIVALTLPHWRHPDEIPGGGRPTVWDSATNFCRFRWPDGETDFYEPTHPIPNDAEDWKRMAAHYMPTWACLHFAEILERRPERLADMTDADAVLEACENVEHYRETQWNPINAARGYPWDPGLWVWALTFRLTEKPEVHE